MGAQASKKYEQDIIVSKDIGDNIRIDIKCEEDRLTDFGDDEPNTAYKAFLQGQRLSDNGPFLGSRKSPEGAYEWLSYSEVSELCDSFGSGLLNECDVASNNDTKIGILASNRTEWIVTDQACARFSFVLVTLYNTLGLEACEHILKQTELSVLVCDNQEKVKTIIDMAPSLTHLRHLIVMDPVDEEVKEKVGECGIKFLSFDDVLRSGRETPQKLNPAKPDDIYSICYTSGTTGVPKGVVQTHKAMLVNVNALSRFLEESSTQCCPGDTNFCYLPLAHTYEKLNTLVTAVNGAKTGFFSGDITKLMEDMAELKPTILTAVPRVLYKVYDRIYAAAKQSYVKHTLLDRAVASKIGQLQNGILRSNTIWDSLVFSKVKAIFGGRIRILITGSAPLEREVMNFFRVALSCAVFSGYGQTEVCGASMSSAHDFHGDHVGAPLPCNYIKLIDVPDLGYKASAGFGEICVKGENTFKEYFKMPKETAATKDEEGWVHTGDVGTWTPQGNLQIVDRCKQIFKLSQGEYIAPLKLEGVFERCQHVSQVFIDGHSDKDYVVAVILPDFEVLATSLGTPDATPETLCENPLTRKLILEEMETVGRSSGLKGFEIVRKIHLITEAFTLENGLLTVTMKSKRNELRKKFEFQISALYDS